MADKKGLPEILSKSISTDISRRNFGRGLTGVATQIATGPLLDSGISAVKNLSKSSSILKKIPMTKELIKQYYKIESLKNKLLDNLSREEKFQIGGLTENTYSGTVESYYEEIKNLTEHKNRLTRYSKITDPDKIDFTYTYRVNKQGNKVTDFREPGEDYVIEKDRIKEELEDVTKRLKYKLDILKDDKNKVQKKAVLELLKLDNEQNEIRNIASDKKLPFNFALEQVAKEEYDFIDDVSFGYGQLSEDPNYESDNTVLNNAREEYLIDDAFENTKKFEDIENKYNIINSIEEKEKIKQAILNDTFMNLKDYNFKSIGGVQGSIQQIIRDPNISADSKERAAEQGAELYLKEEKKRIKSLLESNTYTVYGSGLSGHSFPSGEKEIEPIYSKDILNNVKEEILNAGKTIGGNIVKDYVKDKFVTKGGFKGQELEPGPWLKKLAEYIKSLRTPKPPSSSTIESDKTRAEQAKKVKEVKQKVTPKRNLVKDLKGVGTVIKTSPYVAATLTALTPTKLDPENTAEIPLETSPRGYGVRRRENKGRSSKDPNKNYNRQRFI